MIITSEHWDEVNQGCIKHGIPTLPCPQCLAERDENVRVIVEEMDRIFLVDEMLMAEMDEETATLKDLLPADHADWLIERIM